MKTKQGLVPVHECLSVFPLPSFSLSLLPLLSHSSSYSIIVRYSELSAVAFTDAILCISAVQLP